jgi:hypothetical protein
MQVRVESRERLQTMMREAGEAMWRGFKGNLDPDTGRMATDSVLRWH